VSTFGVLNTSNSGVDTSRWWNQALNPVCIGPDASIACTTICAYW
jgi:hypothetical protein